MFDFHSEILKAISDYKLILRKTLPAVQCTTKMHTLGIKRKNIRKIDEVGLYNIGLKIISELKKHSVVNNKKSSNSYNGTQEFLQYLEELFANYHIEKDRVVHVKQESSCALVDTIQLITMSKDGLTKEVVQKIKQYGNIIASYGSEEQKKMFFDVINSRPALRIEL
ncbi:MAG: hypothetical protein LBL17_00285 [Coxiellaceae bacterium]|jgi:hypothetical protein|nr:hypothetical protein [Coxiellaceae bacterium]